MRGSHALRICIIGVVAFLQMSCGVDNRAGEETQATPSAPAVVSVEYEIIDFNSLVARSDAAVQGTIVDIGPARWNSKDGAPWTPANPDGPIGPILYRDVTLKIERIIYQSDEFSVGPDGTVKVLTLGDGTPSGDEIHGRTPIARSNQIAGPLETGVSVVFVIEQGDFPTEAGYERVLRLSGGFQSNWTIRGDQAISAEPRRTLPLAALVRALTSERAAGPQPARRNKAYFSPLGDPEDNQRN